MTYEVQQSRAKGWRKPEGCISVARPSRWGNPYKVGTIIEVQYSFTQSGIGAGFYDGAREFYGTDAGEPFVLTAEMAVKWYEHDLLKAMEYDRELVDDIAELAGHPLSCFCPIGTPCHRQVLLRAANPGWEP